MEATKGKEAGVRMTEVVGMRSVTDTGVQGGETLLVQDQRAVKGIEGTEDHLDLQGTIDQDQGHLNESHHNLKLMKFIKEQS